MIRAIQRGSLELAVLVVGLIFFVPIFFLLANTFKSQAEMFQSFLAFPTTISIENYALAWKNMRYFRALSNTVIVTCGGVAVVVLFSAMAAYRIARSMSRLTTWLLLFFVVSMMLPFQTIMIPLVQVVGWVGLLGSRFGFIIVAAALLCPFTIYLYRGFFVQIPMELEEAASMEGAGAIRTFFFVVFPLVKSVTVTAVMINALGIWNDFILSLLLLQEPKLMTLQLSVVQYAGRYTLQWNLILATLALVVVPIMLLYLFLQRHIQSGLVSGALKG